MCGPFVYQTLAAVCYQYQTLLPSSLALNSNGTHRYIILTSQLNPNEHARRICISKGTSRARHQGKSQYRPPDCHREPSVSVQLSSQSVRPKSPLSTTQGSRRRLSSVCFHPTARRPHHMHDPRSLAGTSGNHSSDSVRAAPSHGSSSPSSRPGSFQRTFPSESCVSPASAKDLRPHLLRVSSVGPTRAQEPRREDSTHSS